jgi:hypothetical protein
MSFLSSVIIENAYNNHNFCSLPEFFDFPFNCPDFFPENFFVYNEQNKKIIMHIHHKKALSVYPEFSNFPDNFSGFSLHKNLIRIITNIKKKLPNRSSRSPVLKRTKEKKIFKSFKPFLSFSETNERRFIFIYTG